MSRGAPPSPTTTTIRPTTTTPPPADPPTQIPADPVAMMLQMQLMMQQTMQQMLALQQQTASPPQQPPQVSTPTLVKRPDRPTIEADSSVIDWAMFIDSWTHYKAMAKITTLTDTRNELRSSCSPTVNRLLFDFVGAETLNSCTEQQLLQHIKSVAVKGIHKEVHHQRFHSLRQSEGESVTHYLAKLLSQASLCDFRVKCPNESCQAQVSFSEEMISGQLIASLANMDHQGKVVTEADSLTSLQAKFNKLVSLETTDQATSCLHTPVTSICPERVIRDCRSKDPIHPTQELQETRYVTEEWTGGTSVQGLW